MCQTISNVVLDVILDIVLVVVLITVLKDARTVVFDVVLSCLEKPIVSKN